MREVTRRDALAGATALGAVALAGCVADENEDAPAESGDDEPEHTGPGNSQVTDAGVDDESEDTTGNGGETGGDGSVDTSGEDEANSRTDSDRHSSGDSKDDDGDEHRGDETDSADSDEREDRDDDESNSAEGNEGEDGDSDESDSAEGNEREDGSDDDRDGDRRPDGKEVVLNHAVETTDTGCTAKSLGTARKRDVSRANGVVTVEGTLVTSTPCHNVVVESVRYNSGDLALAVSVEPQPGVCIECLGEITYEATVTLSEGVAVDTVSVAYVETDSGVDGSGLSGRPEP